MKILSLQVGLPKDVIFRGKTVTTGIFKSPVKGPLRVKKLNLEGDRQADLTLHGGIDKAIYAYSTDAYPWWRAARPQDVFEFGAFGENLCLDQMPEDQVCIGDTFEVGSAILQVSQPRFPCYKLGVKFSDPKILKTFMKSKRPGVYFRVLREGMIDLGHEMKLVGREKVLLSVLELFTMNAKVDRTRLKEFLTIKSLPPEFLEKFQNFLDEE